MKFKEYEYQRPNMQELKLEFNKLLEDFNEAKDYENQSIAMGKINELRNQFETMATLVSIRHSIDTTDKFYEDENNFMDESGPIYEGLISEYYKALVDSKFKKELETKWGSLIFKIAELKLKTFKPEIIEYLQLENKLTSSYTKLRASSKIFFEGQERNLSGLGPFMESTDSDIRKRAHEAYNGFFADNIKEFDDIYDQLVKVRHNIAKELGYTNYVELGYARLGRLDYDASMVAIYRKQILDEVVPIAQELKARQQKRLGLDKMMYFDESLSFLSGNPMPKGDSDWIMENGKKMYEELSPETNEFFSFMQDNELMDLETKKGKAGGGYCTFIPKYKAPFMFSNFNGTLGDVDVLTHEAGHAFQVYMSRNFELPEYVWPTLEACEIHSMSMEFLTYPWMENFFVEDTQKYKFTHVASGILFLPYGVTVDEFQHFVYENPEMTPEERRSKWSEIEKKYLPHIDYGDNDFLKNGGFWFRQGHIFGNPFYYIDYTLAQVCAFQYFVRSMKDSGEAWSSYLELCKLGGSKSFLELVESAGLKNPFEEGRLKEAFSDLRTYLDGIDDSKF